MILKANKSVAWIKPTDQIKRTHMLSHLKFTVGVYPIGEDIQFAYDTALWKSADNDVTLANYCDPPGGWGAENPPVS